MKHNNFSLVELMVVVAVIGSLISLLTPSLRHMSMQAENMACKTNQRALAAIVFVYTEDHQDRFPLNGQFSSDKTVIYDWSWDDCLSGYDGRETLSDREKRQGANGWNFETNSIYTCPSDDTQRVAARAKRTYSPNQIWNGVGENHSSVGANHVGRGIVTSPYDMTRQRPYSMASTDLSSPSKSIGWLEYPMRHNGMGTYGNLTGSISPYWYLRVIQWPTTSHLHGNFESNYLFLDGHVETMWFPDTLKVVRNSREGYTRNTSDIWNIGSSRNNSILGTSWDCW